METKEKVEIIKQAIKQLMEDEEMNVPTPSPSSSSNNHSLAADDATSDEQHRRRHLLTKLLSQLETMERDEGCSHDIIGVEDKAESKEKDNEVSIEVGFSSSSVEEERIIKELTNVKRQNLITHCLLSAMIVLTLTWQLSEVSLILKIKDGLANPLKSIGGIFGGFLKGGRRQADVQEAMKQVSAKQKDMFLEPTSLPGLKIPELPHLDLPGFDTSEED